MIFFHDLCFMTPFLYAYLLGPKVLDLTERLSPKINIKHRGGWVDNTILLHDVTHRIEFKILNSVNIQVYK